MFPPGASCKQTFTVDDIIKMLQEEARYRGELGWNENFTDPAETFAKVTANLAKLSVEDTMLREAEGGFDDFLIAQTQDERQRYQKVARNRRCMDSVKPLVAKAEAEVTRRLAGYRISKRDIASLILREKVVKLTHLTHPQVANFIRVWVDPSLTTGSTEMFQVKLPLNEHLQEIYAMLKTTVDLHIAGSGTKQAEGGLWKYQLVSRDMKKVINRTSVYLRSDEDYRTLVRTVKGDKKTPVAVLTQENAQSNKELAVTTGAKECRNRETESKGTTVGMRSKGDRSEHDEVIWSDYEMTEPLDDDGHRYFDPYDPDQFYKVAAKYAEKHRGMLE